MTTTIECYLNDGANWQAQSVLGYLRSIRESIVEKTWSDSARRYEALIYVGRYENCREQGYVFTISYMGEYKHYAVYEHRNCDNLVVLINDGFSMNTPSVDFMWEGHDENGETTKWGYDKDFDFGEIIQCGDFITKDMKKFIDEVIAKKNAKKNAVSDKTADSSK